MTERNLVTFSAKKTVLAGAIASVLAVGAINLPVMAESNTSTVGASFILDKTSVPAGGLVNLALMGLDANGKVDQYAEQKGSVIMAVVSSSKGQVKDAKTGNDGSDDTLGNSGASPQAGKFETSVKYIQLSQGLGRVNIYYPASALGEDIVTIQLQELYQGPSAGDLYNTIATETKKVTITPSASAVAKLDIIRFVKSTTDSTDATDDTLATGGIDGKMTAGIAGGQITVTAYTDTGATDTNANGATKVALTGVWTGQTYDLSGDMKAGVATVTVPNSVTKADTYYLSATTDEALFKGNSVDILDDDTLMVLNKKDAKKAFLAVDRTYVAADATGTASTSSVANITVGVLDEYGNLITDGYNGGAGYSIKVVDTADVLADGVTVDSIKAKDSTSIKISQATTAGHLKTTVGKTGTAKLQAVVMTEGANVVSSDVVEVTVVANGLHADASNLLAHSDVTATGGEGLVAHKAYANAFTIYKDSADGTFSSTAKTFVVQQYGSVTKKLAGADETKTGRLLETQTITLPPNATKAEALFDVANGETDYFMIRDSGGVYGATKIDAIGAKQDVIPAQVSKAVYKNGHGIVLASLGTATGATNDTTKVYRTKVYEKQLELQDNFGNRADATGTFEVQSATLNGTPSGDVTGSKAGLVPSQDDTGYGMMEYVAKVPAKTTRGTTPFAGDDTVDVVFSKAGVAKLPLTVTIPELPTLTSYAADIEQSAIPVNGEVALTLTRLDQSGKAYLSTEETIVTISGDVSPTIKYNDTNNVPAGAIITGAKIDFEDGTATITQVARRVLTISAGAKTGEFTLTFSKASDATVKAERKFTVTEKLVTTCAPGVLSACKTETECTTTGKGVWDAATSVCGVATTPTEPTSLGSTVIGKDGKVVETKTSFKGGVKIGDGALQGEATVPKGTKITIGATVTVDPAHVGKKAEKLMVALYQVPGAALFFMNDHGTWKAWNLSADGGLDIAGLAAAADAAALVDPLAIDVFTGTLDFPAGAKIWVYTGYRITETGDLEGALAFNPTPIKLTMGE